MHVISLQRMVRFGRNPIQCVGCGWTTAMLRKKKLSLFCFSMTKFGEKYERQERIDTSVDVWVLKKKTKNKTTPVKLMASNKNEHELMNMYVFLLKPYEIGMYQYQIVFIIHIQIQLKFVEWKNSKKIINNENSWHPFVLDL